MKKQYQVQVLAGVLSGILLLATMLSGCGLLTVRVKQEETKVSEEETTEIYTTGEEETWRETFEETGESVTEEQLAIRQEFDRMLDELLVKMVSQAGINVHDYMEHPEDYGIQITDYVLYNHEEEASEEAQDEIDQWLKEEMARFSIEDLSWQQRIIYEKLQYENEISEQYQDMTTYDTMLSTNNGLISNLSIVLYEYRFLEEKDIQEYLCYLEDIPACMQDVIEGAQESMDAGYAPSQNMLESNIDTLAQLCETEDNPLLEGFDARVDAAEYLSEESKASYKTQNQDIVENVLMPSFQETKAALENWLDTDLPELKGLSSYDGGAEYYEYLVEYYTGSGMSAAELHEYLTDNMEQYMNAFYAVLSGNQDALMMYLEDEYEFPYEDPQEILEQLRIHTEEEFPMITDPGVEVSYLPKVMEIDGVLAYYVTPQIDTDTINVVRLNGSALNDSISTAYSTLGHEGYPGHLYAYNYIKQSGWHPANNLFSYLGYGEGWAEFAGSTSLKWWDLDEDLVKILQIDETMGQILSGIVDTGVNALGWTVEEVEDCLAEYYGLEKGSEDSINAAQSYYDFVTDTPGVILSYSVGYLKVIDLRNAVREVMGDVYTDQAFYKAYLNVSEAPFEIVEKYVMQQIGK